MSEQTVLYALILVSIISAAVLVVWVIDALIGDIGDAE